MIFRKLFIIITGIFLVICAGSCNIYPLYLKTLMDKFSFTLQQVNLYGSFINIGLWVAFPMGFVYDRYGPKISLILGTTLLSGSYLTLYFIMNSSITEFPLILLLILGFVMGQGSALCYTCALTTNLKNFRFKETSSIVGLLVSNMAISPSIFTSYKEFLESVVIARYFLLISIFLVIVISLCALFFKNIKNVYSQEKDTQNYEKYKEKQCIKILILISFIILMIYTFGVTYNNISSKSKFPNVYIFPCLQLLNFIVIIAEYFGVFDRILFRGFIQAQINKINRNLPPLILKDKADKNSIGTINNGNHQLINLENQSEIKNNNTEVLDNCKENTQENIIDNNTVPSKNEEKKIENIQNEGEKMPTPNNLEIVPQNKSVVVNQETAEESDFYDIICSEKIVVIFVMMTFGIGSMISNLNNVEFIVKSIAYGISKKELYEYIVLYFVFNSFFRLISGIVLDKLIVRKKFYHFLIFCTGMGLVSQFLGIFMQRKILFLSIALAGATHGGYMTFLPVYVRTEFGVEHMGKILGVLTTGCALGSVIMSDFVFTWFFEDNHQGACIGKHCFYPAYIITFSIMCFSFLLSFYAYSIHYKNDVREFQIKIDNFRNKELKESLCPQ